ncbi:MAG: SAM-dependent methyltransferase, partial [Methylotenera sp.]|nr:SAM-dependent methyltransferase [Methylotenera sp.]
MAQSPQLGTLYLIPVTLGEDNIAKVLPPDVVSISQQLDTFVVESEKSARHFLSTIKTIKPVRELSLNLLNEHTEDKTLPDLLKPLLAGKDIGLMS